MLHYITIDLPEKCIKYVARLSPTGIISPHKQRQPPSFLFSHKMSALNLSLHGIKFAAPPQKRKA